MGRTNRWNRNRAQMPTRQAATGTLLEDGRVLVFGGEPFPDPVMPSAWVFVPDQTP